MQNSSHHRLELRYLPDEVSVLLEYAVVVVLA